MTDLPDIELIRLAQAGDIAARNLLILRHERFVWMMVRQALGPRRQRLAEEYFASGVEGLMQAIARFDPAHGAGLLTYAAKGIKSRVWSQMLSDTPVTRERVAPTSPDQLERWKQAGSACEFGPGVGDAARAAPVDARLQQLDAAETVTRYVAQLKPLEQSVLYLLYHLGMPRAQAGQELGGLSRARVEQIEQGALARMRGYAAVEGQAGARPAAEETSDELTTWRGAEPDGAMTAERAE